MRRWFDVYGFRMLREGEGEAGGDGGSGGAGGGAEKGRKPKRQDNPLPLTAMVQRANMFISQAGDPVTAVVQLLRDNKRLRDSVNDGQLPDGHRVINAEEGKELDAFRALGKAADVKKMVEEHPTLVSFKTERDTADSWREAAKLVKYDGDVLTKLAKADGLAVEVRTEKVKDAAGKEEQVQTPYVWVASGDKARAMPLASYAKQNLQAYMSALTGSATGNGGAGHSTGTEFPRQGSTDQGSAGDKVQQRLDANKARAAAAFNPLNAPADTKK